MRSRTPAGLIAYFLSIWCGFAVPSRAYAATLPKNFDCRIAFQKAKDHDIQLNHLIDRLLGLESELEIAEATTERLIRESPKTSVILSERQQRKTELAKLRARYDELSSSALDDVFDETHIRSVEVLEQDLRYVTAGSDQSSRVSGNGFSALIDNPQNVKAGVRYEVPQPADTTGHAAVQNLTVAFSDEVLKYFEKDRVRASHFLRALQKGYIAPYAGSGIRRINEYKGLVEVKIKGDVRLFGCRGKNGHLEILKTYVKHNHGDSDFKRFAQLCDSN